MTRDATVASVRALIFGLGFCCLAAALGCGDLREFHGTWRGPRVGADPALLVGALGDGVVQLTIAKVDRNGLHGRVQIAGVVDSPIDSIPGAEADVLAGMTFDGSPLRVYLAFAEFRPTGSALVVISLYDDHRVELRLIRGSESPIYAIFALQRDQEPSL